MRPFLFHAMFFESFEQFVSSFESLMQFVEDNSILHKKNNIRFLE